MDKDTKEYIVNEAVEIAAGALSQAFGKAKVETQIKSDIRVDGKDFELIFRKKSGQFIDMERKS